MSYQTIPSSAYQGVAADLDDYRLAPNHYSVNRTIPQPQVSNNEPYEHAAGEWPVASAPFIAENDAPAKTQPAFPGWSETPSSLTANRKYHGFVIFFDVLMVLLPLAFVIVAILGKYLDGKPVKAYDWGLGLITFTRYGVTIYQILFAAIMGRCAEFTAMWILNRGGSLFVLEQLMGSQSIFSTVKTQWLLRAVNLWSLSLVILWSLSPLGGQGNLRLLSVQDRPKQSMSTVFFANTSYPSGVNPPNYISVKTGEFYISKTNAAFTSVLTGPQRFHSAPQDIWGNVKIPWLSRLDSSKAGADGWIPVPSKNVSYSSLIGLPIANIPVNGKSSFVVRSSYYELDCGSAVQYLPASQAINWYGSTLENVRGNETGQIVGSHEVVQGAGTNWWPPTTASSSLAGLPPFPDTPKDWNPTSPRTLYFQSAAMLQGDNHISAVHCQVTYPTADSLVECDASNCTVISMRSPLDTTNVTSANKSWLDYATGSEIFYSSFLIASGRLINYPIDGSTLIDNYINSTEADGAFPQGDFIGLVNLTHIPSEVIGVRLGRLMNSYWIASLLPSIITGPLPTAADFASPDRIPSTFSMFSPSGATILSSNNVFICHDAWFAILLISASILFVCALITTVLKQMTYGPSVLGHVSSLTRDNPYIPLAPGGSVLDGLHRTRLLKGLEVRLGDVRPEEHVGHVAIMMSGWDTTKQYGKLTRRDKARLYE